MEALLATSFAVNTDDSTIEDLFDTPTLKTTLASPEKDQWVVSHVTLL